MEEKIIKKMNETEVLIISLSVCAIIVIYGKIRCAVGLKDPLTTSLYENQKNFTDGWAFSHFMFFFILTALYPSHFLLIQLLGLIWEVAEFISENHPFYLTECKNDTGDKWWYGRWEDIIVNLLGGLFGLAIGQIKS